VKAPFFFRFTVWVLLALLVIAPPGQSVCWPLLGGRHLHIGWSNVDGHESPTLAVFIHSDDETPATLASSSPSFAPGVPSPVFSSGDLPPLALGLVWALSAITLGWLLLTRAVSARLFHLPALDPPPRLRLCA
jgi:hypothetical protein